MTPGALTRGAARAEIEWAEVVLGGWAWYPPHTRMNTTETYNWLSDPAPWKPPYWGVGAEDYFLFAVLGLLFVILFSAFVHWSVRRCKRPPQTEAYSTV